MAAPLLITISRRRALSTWCSAWGVGCKSSSRHWLARPSPWSLKMIFHLWCLYLQQHSIRYLSDSDSSLKSRKLEKRHYFHSWAFLLRFTEMFCFNFTVMSIPPEILLQDIHLFSTWTLNNQGKTPIFSFTIQKVPCNSLCIVCNGVINKSNFFSECGMKQHRQKRFRTLRGWSADTWGSYWTDTETTQESLKMSTSHRSNSWEQQV